MTQMIHAPGRPSWRLRLPVHLALVAALAVRILPERHRMRVRLALAGTVRRLPPAEPDRIAELYAAVVACQPRWWRGQIDCKERSLATVLAAALTGRRCHLVLGARPLPTAFHAWVASADGTHVGNEEAGGVDHPWTPVHTAP
ncbi:lasso peptide biosynthesis B2 protein [Streptomyces sp. NPDC093108]|uniref:lasso peptide biosynthesis B2 protein n=1 Tax=Streptomyces sp. NPDC093108 TaxID=3366030 RepID=UPI0038076C3E